MTYKITYIPVIYLLSQHQTPHLSPQQHSPPQYQESAFEKEMRGLDIFYKIRSNEKTRKILSHQYLGAPGGGKTSFLYL